MYKGTINFMGPEQPPALVGVDGLVVGLDVGPAVGLEVAPLVGLAVGAAEGLLVLLVVDAEVGLLVLFVVGAVVGPLVLLVVVGAVEGMLVGGDVAGELEVGRDVALVVVLLVGEKVAALVAEGRVVEVDPEAYLTPVFTVPTEFERIMLSMVTCAPFTDVSFTEMGNLNLSVDETVK